MISLFCWRHQKWSQLFYLFVPCIVKIQRKWTRYCLKTGTSIKGDLLIWVQVNLGTVLKTHQCHHRMIHLPYCVSILPGGSQTQSLWSWAHIVPPQFLLYFWFLNQTQIPVWLIHFDLLMSLLEHSIYSLPWPTALIYISFKAAMIRQCKLFLFNNLHDWLSG